VTHAILHISDLHRSPTDPISNDELLSTLVADMTRWGREDPPVPTPDAIIVSGDIIQGVPLNTPDASAQLTQQYGVALDLLSRLADEFVDGDHSRVVVVAGNHDVDWNSAFRAMVPVDESEGLHGIGPWSFGPGTDLRWSWAEQRIYRIVDHDLYDLRFEQYRRFVKAFYADVGLEYPLNEQSYHQLFELNNGRIGVAAFNSCYGNDCFSFHGNIPEEALAQAHLDLRERAQQYDMTIAVWHHNIEGPPTSSDYMDISTVYRLIGKGFRLILHGHQHRAQTSNRYVHLAEEEPIAVVSAGSLCAGARELPTGVNRQYNVLEIDDAFANIRIHIREMAISTVFAPAYRAEFGGKSYVDMKAGPPLLGRTSKARNRTAVLEAEKALQGGDPKAARVILRGLDLEPGSYARALALKALTVTQEWDDLVDTFRTPVNLDELVGVVQALERLRRFDEALAILADYGSRLGLPESTRRDLKLHVEAQRRLV
jgi:3',5'-cyclic AMP phosphodiesterase CpdA